MRYKVSELSGALLDAAVAKALGWSVDGVWCTDPSRPNDPIMLGEPGAWSEGEHFAPGRRWQDGGPLIERERITLVIDADGSTVAEVRAQYDSGEIRDSAASASGPTPLIAAMRCFVASKLGEEVDL